MSLSRRKLYCGDRGERLRLEDAIRCGRWFAAGASTRPTRREIDVGATSQTKAFAKIAATTRGSIFTFVLHLGPVLLEVEVGAVIQIMALHAHIDNAAVFIDLIFHVAFIPNDFES